MKSNAKHEFFNAARLRTGENITLDSIAHNFDTFPASTRQKIENFTNWSRHRDLARFLYRAEIFKSILTIPGCIFECGVLYGAGVSSWLHLSEIFEPVNFSRRIFGFDTFAGFPGVSKVDRPSHWKNAAYYRKGHFNVSHAKASLFEVMTLLDKTRKVPQIPRVKLIEGDVAKTVPALLKSDKSILVSLLYLDMDLYAPTKAVLKACLPRMCKGSVIVFDELNCDDWPGETQAFVELLPRTSYASIERSPLVPHMAVVRL